MKKKTLKIGWLASFAMSFCVLAGAQEFSNKIIDLGVVVNDVEKSAKFYTEAIGMKEVNGFSVPCDYSKAVGLTDGRVLDIRVFVLGTDGNATSLKLMQNPGGDSKASDNAYIHSQLGFSYLTFHVNDMNAALERLKKANVKLVAQSPKELPEGFPRGIYLCIVKDPDGNFVELVGPKK